MFNKFETEDISKLLVQFSLPAIAGMIIHSCYNIVSRMFVGNMGNDGHLGLAALAVVFPVMLLFFSICVLFGLGGANLYSIKLGEKKYDEAENILGMAILSGSIVTAIICIPAYFFSADLLTFFGFAGGVCMMIFSVNEINTEVSEALVSRGTLIKICIALVVA